MSDLGFHAEPKSNSPGGASGAQNDDALAGKFYSALSQSLDCAGGVGIGAY